MSIINDVSELDDRFEALLKEAHNNEEMNLEAQLEEANMIIEEEKQKHQDMNEKLKALEAEIEQLRMRAKELDEEIGE